MFESAVVLAVMFVGAVSSLQKVNDYWSHPYDVIAQQRDSIYNADDMTNAEREMLRDITALADPDRESSDIVASDDSPGFISFNINPYLRHHARSIANGQWDGESNIGDVKQEYKQRRMRPKYRTHGFRDTAYSPAQNVINQRRKRLYLHRGRSREAVSRYQMRQFPYSNVVRLSSGCTGTLLTPLHVLTAAHCVHDGLNFKRNIGMLKVGVPDKSGYRIYYVVKINVPVMWMKTRNLPESGKGAYDYAVLQLHLPVGGRKQFMQLALPDVKTFNSDLQFIGLYSGRSTGIWKATCHSKDNLVIFRENVMLTECDSSVGNSGAAAFSENARDGQRIVGVLSNTITLTPRSPRGEVVRYSAIMLLTLVKCLDICAMIYPEGEKYDVCATVKRTNREYLRVATNRIMPFFG